MTVVDVEASPHPSRAERLALRIVQSGAVAVVLAVSIRKIFELDRFLVPKELVLHAVVLVAGLLVYRRARQLILDNTVDRLLAGFLLLGGVSAVLSTNVWLGFRALAVSTSAVALFWITRALRSAGYSRAVVDGVALAVVVAAVTALLQAYGVRTELFSLNRAPGGTLGNRNFVGHAVAFGLPLLLLAAIRARGALGAITASMGTTVVLAALVLTRSRAAWLAAAAAMAFFALAMVVSRALRRDGRIWRRAVLLTLFAGAGVAAALLLPNTLRWRSDNPYLESVTGVVEFDEGSGAGRLVQYQNTLRLAAAHPLFGAGPGNWPVEYPRHAPRNDRSVNQSEPGTTFNPWPSSDWVAFVAERGPAAAIVLAVAVALLALTAIRRALSAEDCEEALASVALVAMLIATVIAGAFDAVLLLGLPTLLVWSAAGALWVPSGAPRAGTVRGLVLLATIFIAGAAAVRSTAQLVAMEVYATREDRQSLKRAAMIDPANYRLRLRLARGWKKGRCEHALAARALFPNADAAHDLARGCD
jgi:O-antigen ligase